MKKNIQLKVCHVAHVWLAQLNSKPVMVSVVGSIPTGGNFFAETF